MWHQWQKFPTDFLDKLFSFFRLSPGGRFADKSYISLRSFMFKVATFANCLFVMKLRKQKQLSTQKELTPKLILTTLFGF